MYLCRNLSRDRGTQGPNPGNQRNPLGTRGPLYRTPRTQGWIPGNLGNPLGTLSSLHEGTQDSGSEPRGPMDPRTQRPNPGEFWIGTAVLSFSADL